jgi:hypothetical protein
MFYGWDVRRLFTGKLWSKNEQKILTTFVRKIHSEKISTDNKTDAKYVNEEYSDKEHIFYRN